jgi:hypothetical protein
MRRTRALATDHTSGTVSPQTVGATDGDAESVGAGVVGEVVGAE